MERKYEPAVVEAGVQQRWKKEKVFELGPIQPEDEIYYCLEMFPYPSGKLHMGHVRNYAIGDAVARFQRMRGRRVLYPMGFDAFGLPAENAAIQGGVPPQEWTEARIEEMTAQLVRMGFSYDWTRTFATCRPEYYRWNQYFFLKFLERGLAYRKAAPVNWCPECRTVLANEQVHEGCCWRHEETPVERRDLTQWFFRTTAYAERLLANLDSLEGWPDHVKEMQRHWIGRSEGVTLRFPSRDATTGEEIVIETYTTRPDTVYGITYLVLAPEHPLVDRLVASEQKEGLKSFRAEVARQTLTERTDGTREKKGYALGNTFTNPFTGEECPLFVADYALMDYGTGAVMAVPAHDQRDFEFARAHGLPVRPVIHPPGKRLIGAEMTEAYEDDGIMANSGDFNGWENRRAWEGIADLAEERGWGRRTVQYRLRDWLISRQRYWGTPIPVLYCETCGVVPASDLPVLLPREVRFTEGGNPLTTARDFVETTCPKCGGAARRETDTMDTFVDSSWYFLRYCDPSNTDAPFSPETVRGAMPVDQYIGGVEHACMHLIYARFFNMVLYDMGLVPTEEPFRNLLTQGMVSLETYSCPEHGFIYPAENEDGRCQKCGSKVTVGRVEKMSKSKKNTIDPGEIIERYGADTARTFILFAAPPENELIWSSQGVEGAWRFLRRIYDLVERWREYETADSDDQDKEIRRKTHDTIRRVTRDIEERFQFNTAIAALMELVNRLQAVTIVTPAAMEGMEVLLKCLSPIAPHLCQDRWERLGKTTLLVKESWPELDEKALEVEEVEVPVQVKGKLRARIRIAPDAPEPEAVAAAAAALGITEEPKRVIYRPGRILNLIL
ncbi:MAG: leucine--tRNA ligase [Candidatus Hydrogenedentota bacterium]|nr:MAG: leucine--tRNA ligase [Candidatus Hydrogenedentota bacterium]